jgi:CBS domain containing-hemolysin-like protein
MSGLTVGLLSINVLDLEIKARIGSPAEQARARVIMPILEHHHWLLVTLLFCNACALEALPLFLDRIVPSAYAVLISVVAVLIVGEVIPQAICIGPRQLEIAEKSGPIVAFLMRATAPVSWPIAKLLDHLLGGHALARFNASQLGAIIDMHSHQALADLRAHGEISGIHEAYGANRALGLDPLQAQMSKNIINQTEGTAFDALKKIQKVFMLSCDRVVDQELINEK